VFKLLSILLLSFALPTISQAQNAHAEVTALGKVWQVRAVTWKKVLNQWSVTGVFLDEEVDRAGFAESNENLEAICNAMLAEMPAAPYGVKREDLFRVQLNFGNLEFGRSRAATRTAFLNWLSIPVNDSECKIDPNLDLQLFTYPRPIGEWQFRGAKLDITQPGRTKFVVLFVRQDDGSLSEFDYELACRAVFEDVSSMLSAVAKDAGLDSVPLNFELEIISSSPPSHYASQVFDVEDGGFCLPGNEL